MRKPTEDLEAEHGGITLMLKIIGKISERLVKGENVNRDNLIKVVDFLQNFADKCHHGKEEGILFPQIVKDEANVTLVNELLGEHKSGRDYIKGIAESLDKYKPGNPDAIHIATNMNGYIRLLTDHINKENTILFPIADIQLSEDAQSEIIEKFEILEQNIIGVGKHEEYHGWLKELKNIYLG